MQPNILFITAHDLGRHLGSYGVRTVHTPNLDRLAREGARLSNCFCVAPQCSPSRAAMVTGRYPHSNGVLGLTHSHFGWDMHPGEKHLAQLLQTAGYHTVLGSFQHEYRRSNSEMGFAEALGLRGMADTVSEGAANWLSAQAGARRPFYLQLGFFEPHRYVPGEQFGHNIDDERGVTIPPFLRDDETARTELARFQGAIRALDAGIGRVLHALEASGLGESTLVLFSADHGIPFPRAKCSLYDPGLEIAALWRLPKHIPAGQSIGGLRTNLDFMPTLLELCDLPIPANVQGRSIANALRGQADGGRDEIYAEMTYHEYFDPIRCIRTNTHKLIANFSTAPSFMNPSQCWRPLTTPAAVPDPAMAYHPPVELYDLREDLYETRNLAGLAEQSTLQVELSHHLLNWMRNTNDPLLLGMPAPPAYHSAMRALRLAPQI